MVFERLECAEGEVKICNFSPDVGRQLASTALHHPSLDAARQAKRIF